MEERIYTNIIESFLEINHLKSVKTFYIERLDDEQKKDILNYHVIEYVFEGVQSKRNQEYYRELFNKFVSHVKEIVFNNQYNYIFIKESFIKKASRLRSYKGFIDKGKLTGDNFIEKESFIGDSESVFMFIGLLDSFNFNYLVDYFFDSDNSFIISSNEEFNLNNTLNKLSDLIITKNDGILNYLDVIFKICKNKNFIYRTGGDGGEEYWSLQKFYNRSCLSCKTQ
ncbi:MAG: hypothetical protein LBP34_06015 [Flavobacteriaceae bacterium]|jgi:hypothetical protein|nr:hypothetical protein [Flavobacteriaceae bacterium]